MFGEEAVTKREAPGFDGSTLQRPPPLITIFLAPLSVLSRRSTGRPFPDAKIAAIVPAAPAPTAPPESVFSTAEAAEVTGSGGSKVLVIVIVVLVIAAIAVLALTSS